MSLRRTILSLLLLAALPAAALPASTVMGRVVGVSDGDTPLRPLAALDAATAAGG
ncbi:MAG: hypothetical protein GX548_01685 [Lentisphaerae bacterium]|nr:hypothetical protein [Lentisphaerota bacterium]